MFVPRAGCTAGRFRRCARRDRRSRSLAQLRERIEAVFRAAAAALVERLPRNEVGKLPREALLSLWAQRHELMNEIITQRDRARTIIRVSPDIFLGDRSCPASCCWISCSRQFGQLQRSR